MKKLFTIDDFMVAFIAALGYGLGQTIAKLLGWPELMCAAASFVVGMASEGIISGIVFSKVVQKSRRNRTLILAATIFIFLAAQYICVMGLGVSMLDYLTEQIEYTIGLPVLGFVLSMLIRGYQIRRIRKLYGDGSEGYVFDVKSKDLEKLNAENRPVSGRYDADCAVNTKTGVFVGTKYKRSLCFMGIPYAKPTVGGLRWKAPETLPPSEAVFEAENFGASAVQVEHKGMIISKHRQSEDCLTLNIAVSSQTTETKKPVLVVFHHGDFTSGGSVDPLLYGGDFVNNHPDVVYVTFNYRLGIFGFIDFSKVPGGEAYPDARNLGLLDQIAALRWIRENIAAFGGDPEKVTVLGFEAGATSICMLAACEQAKGLFQRAFIFNGSPVHAYDTPEGSESLAENLLKETQTSTMEELIKLDTETLKDAAQKLWRNMCAPTCDGALIPGDVYRACREGAASGIDFVIGIPSREMQVMRSVIGAQNYEALITAAVADMQQILDPSTAAAVEEYLNNQPDASAGTEAKTKLIEQWSALCIYRLAARLKEGGNKVHLMYWDEKPLIENLGSGTVDAAATLLGNAGALHMYGSVLNKNLSEALQTFLIKFINGNSLRLYQNEIKGVDAFDWKAFPKTLIVSDGKLSCETIEDRLEEVKALFDFAIN